MDEPVSSELAAMAVTACWAIYSGCIEMDCYHGALEEAVEVLRQCDGWTAEEESTWLDFVERNAN